MDFTLTDEQRMFRETVYRYGKEEIAPLCGEAELRGEFSPEIWGKLGEMGLLGLPFSEEMGGSGADLVTCCLAGEALGHAGVDGGSLLAWGHIPTSAAAISIISVAKSRRKSMYRSSHRVNGSGAWD